jgi:hypothetical protein
LHELAQGAGAGASKVLAAWELAKFHAIKGQWDQALYYLEIVNQDDRHFLRGKSAGLLFIEALAACGKFDEAEHHARRVIDKGECGPDYYGALSNVVVGRVVPQKRVSDLQLMRLTLLNRLYKRAKVVPLELATPARGFSFGNLAAAERRLSYVDRPERISVLMTTFNADQCVSTAMSGILGQTWRNVELVVVDDGSTDATWQLIERLALTDKRIVHLRNATSLGVYQARNKALSLATGDYVMVYGSHCWAHPQMLHAQFMEMHSDPVKMSFPGMATVSPDMKYVLELTEDNGRYIRRSDRSYLVGRRDLQRLGDWDAVAGNSDEEFIRRAAAMWGEHCLRDVLPNAPLLLCLDRSPASGEPERRSLTYGASHEYGKQAEFWRKNILLPAVHAGKDVTIERTSTKRPFPIPNELAPARWPRDRHYNLIIISDMTLLGGTRRCNEGYIAAAANLGMRVGLFHWARYDLRIKDDIAREYRILSYSENIDILTAEDGVNADFVIIHHPPIMRCLPDEVPEIQTERLAILVNQLPQPPGESGNPYYERDNVEATCLKLFGMAPVWIPISPLVRRVLVESGFGRLAKEDWTPPLGKMVVADRSVQSHQARRGRNPVIGRHSRDHWTKWPEIEQDLLDAYCADSELQVRFLGGAASARKVLGRWPQNWQDFAFDSMPVSKFLNDLDFLVHFTHSGYVEEFGRNVMEAMAAGIPAITPPRFREVFGDAACYAEPREVRDLIRALWDSESAYVEQVDRGFRFVSKSASNECVERRLREATNGTI